jgi:beta-glucuronidase
MPFFKRMIDAARAADPSRPLGYVAHLEPVQQDNGPAALCDFIGVNKYFGWYVGHGRNDAVTTQALVDCLQSFYDTYQKPILLAEFGADTQAGIGDVPEQAFSEGFQAEIVVRQARAVQDLPFILGVHMWNFADFATGQQLNRMHGNKKGAFTRNRKPKMVAYGLRQLWTGIGFGETDTGPNADMVFSF